MKNTLLISLSLLMCFGCQNPEQEHKTFIIEEEGPPSACDCAKNSIKVGTESFDKILQKRCEVYAEKLSKAEKEARAIEGMKCIAIQGNSQEHSDCESCSMDIAQKLANSIIQEFKNSQNEIDAQYASDIQLENIEQRPNCSYVATFKIFTLDELLLKDEKYFTKRFQCDGKEMYIVN